LPPPPPLLLKTCLRDGDGGEAVVRRQRREKGDVGQAQVPCGDMDIWTEGNTKTKAGQVKFGAETRIDTVVFVIIIIIIMLAS